MVVVRVPSSYFKTLRDKVPYVVVAVTLAEGPKLYGNLVDTAVTDLKVGMSLQAVLTPAADGAGMVNFRAA